LSTNNNLITILLYMHWKRNHSFHE
jgi:hypothetical protein